MESDYFGRDFVTRFFMDWDYLIAPTAPPEHAIEAILECTNSLNRLYKVILPSPSESTIIALDNPKSAALCSERVWSPIYQEDVPIEIAFRGATFMERAFLLIQILSFLRASRSFAKGDVNGAHEALIQGECFQTTVMRGKGHKAAVPVSEPIPKWSDLWNDLSFRAWVKFRQMQALSKALKNAYNLDVPTLHNFRQGKFKQYETANYPVVVNVLENLKVVDEHRLTWEQVLEFRKDVKAKRTFRRLVHWLDAEMVGKPLPFIEDEIAQRLEGYEWAVKKHGLETLIGSLSAALDSKILLTGAGALAAGHTIGQDWIGMLTGASIVVGNCAVHFAREVLDIEQTKRSHPEIHFVHEVKKFVG